VRAIRRSPKEFRVPPLSKKKEKSRKEERMKTCENHYESIVVYNGEEEVSRLIQEPKKTSEETQIR